ncbi:MAG: hypothetical protein KGL69_05335 [Alphaproteobacteria bacterium]|nr:hypothetical protein [Alphaproteobacteria bacterium]
MEIHKPKPAHNLREFLSEIAVVVIGIVIALGGEQALEAVSWHEKIHVAEAAMRRELQNDDGPQAVVREDLRGCFKQQLTTLRQAIIARAPRNQIAALAAAYSPPYRTWDQRSYQAALAAGVTGRLSAERFNAWSQPFLFAAAIDRLNGEERNTLIDMQAILPGPGPLSPEEGQRALRDEMLLERANDSIAVLARLMDDTAVQAGAGAPAAARRSLLDLARSHFGDCARPFELPKSVGLNSAQLMTQHDLEL